MGGLHPVAVNGAEMTFHLPNNQGSFSGKFEAERIVGQWVSGHASSGDWNPSSPVVLIPAGPSRMRGTIIPLDNEFTLLLLVQKAGGRHS
jgi:hypothetical protein